MVAVTVVASTATATNRFALRVTEQQNGPSAKEGPFLFLNLFNDDHFCSFHVRREALTVANNIAS
jgi:hypothetical protein